MGKLAPGTVLQRHVHAARVISELRVADVIRDAEANVEDAAELGFETALAAHEQDLAEVRTAVHDGNSAVLIAYAQRNCLAGRAIRSNRDGDGFATTFTLKLPPPRHRRPPRRSSNGRRRVRRTAAATAVSASAAERPPRNDDDPLAGGSTTEYDVSDLLPDKEKM